MADVVVSDHARFEMERRGIEESQVLEVAGAPEQIVEQSHGRLVYQSRYSDPAVGKEMLIRLILEPRQDGLYLITVYKTSKVEKYWQGVSK